MNKIFIKKKKNASKPHDKIAKFKIIIKMENIKYCKCI